MDSQRALRGEAGADAGSRQVGRRAAPQLTNIVRSSVLCGAPSAADDSRAGGAGGEAAESCARAQFDTSAERMRVSRVPTPLECPTPAAWRAPGWEKAARAHRHWPFGLVVSRKTPVCPKLRCRKPEPESRQKGRALYADFPLLSWLLTARRREPGSSALANAGLARQPRARVPERVRLACACTRRQSESGSRRARGCSRA